MKTQIIKKNSPYLKNIISLWRKNSNTLGFLPEGAFEEYANKRCILISVDEDNILCGYLLFRIVSQQQIVIVHLCVKEEYRKKGVGGSLINELRNFAKSRFTSIKLECRRDYEGASEFWRNQGFIYAGEKIGRSGNPVIFWNMNLSEPPLLVSIQDSLFQNKLKVVIDMNIFIRIQDPIPEDDNLKRVMSEEAKALEEDWLNNDIVLCITDELKNEIEKNDNSLLRARRLKFAHNFENIGGELNEVRKIEQEISCFFSEIHDDNVISDIRQLAYSILGGANFFITHDTGILNKADIFFDKYSIRVLRPGGIIAHLDEMRREADYKPQHLASSRITHEKVTSDQIEKFSPEFLCSFCKEKGNQFVQILNSYIAQPDKFSVYIIKNHEFKPLALVVYDVSEPNSLNIPLLRVTKSQLSGTLLRYLALISVTRSIREKRVLTTISETCKHSELGNALEEVGFTYKNNKWIKINLSITNSHQKIIESLYCLEKQIQSQHKFINEVITAISQAMYNQDLIALADIERRLWPGKIIDANIPTYIIPIKPYWAQHLFDEKMACQTLFGAREDLALRNENVYYRSSKSGKNLIAPARILWYVTEHKSYTGTKSIRACSFLDEIIIGKASELYKRFQRLGIYEWKDIIEIANNDPEGEIMVLRFSNTEIFDEPIDLKTQKEILQIQENKGLMVQSPRPILPQTFERIYNSGIKNC